MKDIGWGARGRNDAPQFNSMHIESTKNQIWIRANASQKYKRSSVESSSVSSKVKASPSSLYRVAGSSIYKNIRGLFLCGQGQTERWSDKTSLPA